MVAHLSYCCALVFFPKAFFSDAWQWSFSKLSQMKWLQWLCCVIIKVQLIIMMVENRYKIPPFFISLVGSCIYDKKAVVQLVPEYDWSSDLLEKCSGTRLGLLKRCFGVHCDSVQHISSHGRPMEYGRPLYFCSVVTPIYLSSFFPCLISAVAGWMSAILAHMVWP